MAKREKREPRVVAQPPPEAVSRVDDGGPWGPTSFDLPARSGSNRTAIILTAAAAALVLLLLVAYLWWFYLHS